MGNNFNGLLNVNKEAGFTSNDVVAKLRGILRQRKIGHTGTLDPDAVGVMVVCLGGATKLCDVLTEHTKEYIAVCRLGVTTDTQDMSGKVISSHEVDVDEESLHTAVMAFVGEYDQIPPMYSALKVGGKKLYELAREGKEIERKPRRIKISSISILDTSHLLDEHVFTMEIRCSRGTYIRTLCNDIGEKLGCGAAMQHLTRTAVGSFRLEDSLTLTQIEHLRDEEALADHILSVETVYKDLDRVTVSNEFRKQLENGNAFGLSNIINENPDDEQDIIEIDKQFEDRISVRAYGEDGVFFGVYKYDARLERFCTDKFFYNSMD